MARKSVSSMVRMPLVKLSMTLVESLLPSLTVNVPNGGEVDSPEPDRAWDRERDPDRGWDWE
jgi:hypothetical protein